MIGRPSLMLNALIYIEATSSNRNEIYPTQQHLLVLDYYACDSFVTAL